MRVIIRRERPHPGAQLSLFEERDGWRYQAFVTNTKDGQLAFLEARHRAHARVEDRIRHAKDTGLGRFPSREFAINQAWLMLTAVAADLTAWTRLLAFTGDAKVLMVCEPKSLRYRFLHVPARLTHSVRRRRLQNPRNLALGSCDRRGVRQHRSHPATRLTTRSPTTRGTRRTAPGSASRLTVIPGDDPDHRPEASHRVSPHHDRLMNDRG